MKVLVYYSRSNEIMKRYSLDELLLHLPKSIHVRAKRFKISRAAYNYVIGRHMLRRIILERNLSEDLDHIKFNKNGKPQHDSFYFNISHSYDLVLCAVSFEGPLGIDVEKVIDVQLNPFQFWFNEIEWSSIMSSENPINKFYWYWTRKESVIKALGVNFNYLLEQPFDFDKNIVKGRESNWFLSPLNEFEGYVGSICTKEKIISMNLEEVNNFN